MHKLAWRMLLRQILEQVRLRPETGSSTACVKTKEGPAVICSWEVWPAPLERQRSEWMGNGHIVENVSVSSLKALDPSGEDASGKLD
ncbi:hypothetical protein BH20ACI3_BH20ACI3_04440 [soil metagenome]